jgi:hypothetical protein
MRHALTIAPLLAWAGLLLLPGRARGQIVIAESIEWVLATSDRVIVGQVVKVGQVTGPDKKDYQAVTVAISRTLKGAHADRETFLLHPYIYRGYARQWLDEGLPILLCLVKNDGKRLPLPPEKFAWVLREDGNGPNAVLLGKSKHYWTGSSPVLTRDFEVLTEPEAILKFVERTVKAAAKGPARRSHTLDVPGGTAVYKKLWSRSAVRLIVPVDATLEALGRRWCKGEGAWERYEGARILRHFRNETNVGLLKSLLGDPSTSEATLHRTVPGKVELELVYRKKLYYVRQAAFDALREFGVNVDRPVLEELLEGRDDPGPRGADRERAIGPPAGP